MREEEVEAVADFVRRFCAIESGEESLRSGYFAFYQGKSARAARKARAPVAFGEVEKCSAEVLRRCRELASNGEGHVFLRAYETGETSPLEQLRIGGTLEDQEADIDTGGDAVAALTHALVRTNGQLLDENRDLRRVVAGHQQNALEMTEQFTLAVVHSRLLADNMAAGQMEAAMQQLTPVLEKVAPAFAGWAFGAETLPEDPIERTKAGVQRILGLSQVLGQTHTKHPEQRAAIMAELAPLAAMVTQLAPFLGLVVMQAPPPEPPPDDHPVT